jgi:hypothetical protein
MILGFFSIICLRAQTVSMSCIRSHLGVPLLSPNSLSGSVSDPSRIQGSKRHRIPDPDPQHCRQIGANKRRQDSNLGALYESCLYNVGKFATDPRRMGKVSGTPGTWAISRLDLTAEPPSGLSTASSRRVFLTIS